MGIKQVDQKDIQQECATIGMAEASIIGSMTFLYKEGIRLKDLLFLKSRIDYIVCNLWTLLPLTVGKDYELLEAKKAEIREDVEKLIEVISIYAEMDGRE